MRHVRKRPMATPVKKERESTPFTVKGAITSFHRFSALIRKRSWMYLSLGILILIAYFIWGTSFFTVKTIVYKFSDASDECITEQVLERDYFKTKKKIWSYLFFDTQPIRTKYPCLENIGLSWNPFSFSTLTVRLEATIPVAEVLITRTDVTAVSGTSDQYFLSQSLGEEVRYVTKEGKLISLVASPSVPKWRYRIMKGQKIEEIHFSEKELITLMQLSEYLRTSIPDAGTPDVVPDGTVRFSTTYAEEVYVTLHDDLSTQFGSLQAILGTSTIDKKKIRFIDLRFGNPVVRFR